MGLPGALLGHRRPSEIDSEMGIAPMEVFNHLGLTQNSRGQEAMRPLG